MKRNVFSYKMGHFVEKRNAYSSGGAKSLGRQWTSVADRQQNRATIQEHCPLLEGTDGVRGRVPLLLQTSHRAPHPLRTGASPTAPCPRVLSPPPPCVLGVWGMELIPPVKKRWTQKELQASTSPVRDMDHEAQIVSPTTCWARARNLATMPPTHTRVTQNQRGGTHRDSAPRHTSGD